MSKTKEVMDLFSKYVIANYGRNETVFTHASDCYIWDIDENRFIDFFPGWATTSIGHCHPRVVKAVQAQVARLIHVDNTFYTVEQGRLARLISEHSFGGQCFFCNSGAEANEGAIKLARIHLAASNRYKIVTLRNSFHGRTNVTITATGQDKYHQGIGPLAVGFEYAAFNDMDDVKAHVDESTAAVLFEPIQGEGGINVASPEFMAGVRKLCDDSGMLLILDEVQTGMGRTGEWFGYQHYDVVPDIITLAKALGGGVAIGAMAAKPEVAASLKPGLHASTFGGNPLACAAGIAVFEAIESDGLMENCLAMSKLFFDHLNALAAKLPGLITDVRGKGLMIGVELSRPGDGIFRRCLAEGLRINCTHGTVLRLMPPMTVTREIAEEGLAILDKVIEEEAGAAG